MYAQPVNAPRPRAKCCLPPRTLSSPKRGDTRMSDYHGCCTCRGRIPNHGNIMRTQEVALPRNMNRVEATPMLVIQPQDASCSMRCASVQVPCQRVVFPPHGPPSWFVFDLKNVIAQIRYFMSVCLCLMPPILLQTGGGGLLLRTVLHGSLCHRIQH